MFNFFRYIVNSRFLVVLLPTIIFVGMFVFLKFFFMLFSDRHHLKVNTPSDKIATSIRDNIGNKKYSTKNNIKIDSSMKVDNYYDQKESYNNKATKKDTTLRK